VDMQAVLAMSIDKYYNELRTLLREGRLYKSIKKKVTVLLFVLKHLS